MFKKIFDSKLFKWVRYIRQQLENQRQNRECIGEDNDGNKYYQYYSYWGLPTRRQIRYKKKGNFLMGDLVYYRWLHNQQFDPPSETEKQQFYLQQKTRFQRALWWDKKEERQLQQFRKKKEELLLRDKAMAQLEKQLQANSELTNIKTRRTVNFQNKQLKNSQNWNENNKEKGHQKAEDNKELNK